MKRISLFIILCCIPFAFIRAQFITDSLSNRLLRIDLPPAERVTTMALLAKSKSNTDTKNAIRIAEKALELCEQLKAPSRYKSFVYSVALTGEPYEAEATYLQALKYLEGTKAYSNESFVYYYLALAYEGMASYYLNVYIHAPL